MSTSKRLLWIQRQYPPQVTARVIEVIQGIRGLNPDDLSSEIARLGDGHRPFDPYLPWLAKGYNDQIKVIFRTVRRIHPSFTKDQLLPLLSCDEDVWDLAKERLVHSDELTAEIGKHAITTLNEGLEQLHSIDFEIWEGFTEVVDWAAAESVDMSSVGILEAIERSDQWHASLDSEPRGGIATPGEVLHTWPDKGSMQRLVSKPQLNSEARAMAHCVGGYWDRVHSGAIEIWSLRNPEGASEVTLEVIMRHGEIQTINQARGYENELPTDLPSKRVVDYLKLIDLPLQRWGEPLRFLPDDEIVQAWKGGVELPYFLGLSPVRLAIQRFTARHAQWEHTQIKIKDGRLEVTYRISYNLIHQWSDEARFRVAMEEEGLWERFKAVRDRLYPKRTWLRDDKDMLRIRFAGQILDPDPERHWFTMPPTIITRRGHFALPELHTPQQFADDLAALVSDILATETGFHSWAKSQIGSLAHPILPFHRPRLHEVMDLVEGW